APGRPRRDRCRSGAGSPQGRYRSSRPRNCRQSLVRGKAARIPRTGVDRRHGRAHGESVKSFARIGLCTLVAVAAVLGASAQTGRAAITCPGQTYVQPFTPWLDYANYVMLPNGSFESTDEWSLSGGASQVSGNEPFYVNDSGDSNSLALPSGASAVSPSMCFTLLHP